MRVRGVIAGMVVSVVMTTTGCSGASGQSDADKIQYAIQSLGGTTATLYRQEVLSKDLKTGAYATLTVFVVASKDGRSYHVVDAQGEIYDDFSDFLRNNRSANVTPG